MFRDFGSLLALVIRFTSLAISTTQGFSLSNSLIKKLYSASEPDFDDSSNHALATSPHATNDEPNLETDEAVPDPSASSMLLDDDRNIAMGISDSFAKPADDEEETKQVTKQ